MRISGLYNGAKYAALYSFCSLIFGYFREDRMILAIERVMRRTSEYPGDVRIVYDQRMLIERQITRPHRNANLWNCQWESVESQPAKKVYLRAAPARI